VNDTAGHAEASTIAPAKRPSTLIGAGYITAAFFLVAVMSALGKSVNHVPTAIIVFSQTFVSLVIFAPWALRGGVSALKTEHFVLHLVRAMGGLLSQVLMFIALRRMSLMGAVLLSNSAPLFIPLVAMVWLHEKIRPVTWFSLLIGFLGIVLILRPGPDLLKNPSAIIAAVAAVCSAVGLVAINQLSQTDSSQRVLIYYFFISSVLTAPFMILTWRTPDRVDALKLLGIGVCLAASQLLIILAYRHARPERIAPFNYSVVIFSGLFGWIFWGTTPGLLSVAGILLVCAGGILSTVLGGPNSRGHMLWIGHWNIPFLRRFEQELSWVFPSSKSPPSNAS
jgi:drug/metabolite transporter (DMT)-like permease